MNIKCWVGKRTANATTACNQNKEGLGKLILMTDLLYLLRKHKNALNSEFIVRKRLAFDPSTAQMTVKGHTSRTYVGQQLLEFGNPR